MCIHVLPLFEACFPDTQALSDLGGPKVICALQVQKTRGAMADCSFWDVRVLECLLHDYEVRTERIITDIESYATAMNAAALGKYCAGIGLWGRVCLCSSKQQCRASCFGSDF